MPESLDKTAEPQLTTCECEELDVWSAEVGWQTDYQQAGKGEFDAWFEMSLCQELRVVDQYCNREMSASGIPPAGFIPLLLPLNRGDRGIFQGKQLEENEVALVGPGAEATYRTPPDLRMFSLHLPVPRVRKAFRALADEELDPLLGEVRLVTLPHKIFQRLASIGRQVIDAVPRLARNGATGVWQAELEEYFVTALISGFQRRGETEPGKLARKNRVNYVTVARDYIEAHLDTPLGIETLARETGVSPRTLEYAFREVFDTTPLNYIKVRRLHAARRRLLDVDNPDVTVTDVALNYGFNHLSHFAQDYHSLFGELPSQTLRSSF